MDELLRGDIVIVPHGRLVMLPIAAHANDCHDDEVQVAGLWSEFRRNQFLSGRRCLRRALAQSVLVSEPLLIDRRGAPKMPLGFSGSVSHKADRVVALVQQTARPRSPAFAGSLHDWPSFVGVDIERAAPSRYNIASRILTDDEMHHVNALPDVDRGRAVTLRFSIKEAIYKAIDPIVQRYVGFREVPLRWHGDSVVDVAITLDGQRIAIEVWWTELDGYWISTAQASRV
jgi:enterobactin synthetase component D